jgi:hypothetical protein
MTKGLKEMFKVELYPDLQQKKEINAIEKEAGKLFKLTEKELADQYNLVSNPRSFHSEQLIMKVILENKKNLDLDLLSEFSKTSIIESAYASFLQRVYDANGKNIEFRAGRRIKPEIGIPVNEVIFSKNDKTVVIPYIGLTRFKQHKSISAILQNEMSRMFIGTMNAYFYLLIDRIGPMALRRRKKFLPGQIPFK